MKKIVYLDNGATTKVLDEAKEACVNYMQENFFNPSALYENAIKVARDIKSAREKIANILGVEESTIVFTSSGTESDNQALFCSRKKPASRIIISASEHSAVYNSAMELKQRGFDVVLCKVDVNGKVVEEDFARLLTKDVSLVSIMHVNNVTGAVNDIKKLVEMTKEVCPNALFHSDGVQAFCKIPTKLKSLGVDLYSASSHKIGGVKGSGFLYVKKGLNISPLLFGGGQERGLRSSTENVPAIMSFAKAAELAFKKMPELKEKGNMFFDELKLRLQAEIKDLMFLTPENHAPHIFALTFKDVRGETLMHTLEDSGFILGIGSACSSKKGTARIPESLGLNGGFEQGMIRISINPYEDYDAEALAGAIVENYKILRKYTRV